MHCIATVADATSMEAVPPALKRFKLVSARISAENSTAANGNDTPLLQLNKYLAELQEGAASSSDPLTFWRQRRCSFNLIVDFAADVLAAPASQAFIERVFSVCGILTQGRRSRMAKSLQMRVRLKLNRKVLSSM